MTTPPCPAPAHLAADLWHHANTEHPPENHYVWCFSPRCGFFLGRWSKYMGRHGGFCYAQHEVKSNEVKKVKKLTWVEDVMLWSWIVLPIEAIIDIPFDAEKAKTSVEIKAPRDVVQPQQRAKETVLA